MDDFEKRFYTELYTRKLHITIILERERLHGEITGFSDKYLILKRAKKIDKLVYLRYVSALIVEFPIELESMKNHRNPV